MTVERHNRILTLVAGIVIGATGARHVQADTADVKSPRPPIPAVWSFKGGISSALNFDWYRPTGEQAGSSFGLAGMSIEAHNVRGFVAGVGADLGLKLWSSETELYTFGPTSQHLFTLYLYGTLGHNLWTSADRRIRTWGSFDAGRVWCSEEARGPGFGRGNDFAGTAVRVRASYLRHVSEIVALGITAGWQWAEPGFQSRRYQQPVNPTPQLNLSGPIIAAQLSLVSPLGKK